MNSPQEGIAVERTFLSLPVAHVTSCRRPMESRPRMAHTLPEIEADEFEDMGEVDAAPGGRPTSLALQTAQVVMDCLGRHGRRRRDREIGAARAFTISQT